MYSVTKMAGIANIREGIMKIQNDCDIGEYSLGIHAKPYNKATVVNNSGHKRVSGTGLWPEMPMGSVLPQGCLRVGKGQSSVYTTCLRK